MSDTPKVKMLPMEKRKANLIKAIEIIESVPVKQFDLDQYCNINSKGLQKGCGTLGCTMGWLSVHPYFKQQGMIMESGSVMFYPPNVDLGETGISDTEITADSLFGKHGWHKYFAAYAQGQWDCELRVKHNLPARYTGVVKGEHHKKLAIARLKEGLRRIH